MVSEVLNLYMNSFKCSSRCLLLIIWLAFAAALTERAIINNRTDLRNANKRELWIRYCYQRQWSGWSLITVNKIKHKTYSRLNLLEQSESKSLEVVPAVLMLWILCCVRQHAVRRFGLDLSGINQSWSQRYKRFVYILWKFLDKWILQVLKTLSKIFVTLRVYAKFHCGYF